ncbi:MAG: ATP-binding protein [Verrucomicrobia bacterium]|nr:ATP-binding protein [Verrucomicrobiota bacterium]
MREIIRQKLGEALVFRPPEMTRRQARLPAIPNKVRAVIGMRRAGKTWFLYQCLQDMLAVGRPREALVYFSFEDERLAAMEALQLQWVLEEYFVLCPQFRDREQVTFFFDEIQQVSGWETFVRRIHDSEKVEVFVSGSSARLLSREVATALRGRGTETIVFPFGFGEYLRHHSTELPRQPSFTPKAARSRIERAFREYLSVGGFPEAQGLAAPDRLSLLQGYVDATILRDVLERHGMTNLVALRRLVRHLLGSPAGAFSVTRFYNDLRSAGVAVARDALHHMLACLEDTFLVRLVSLASSSERRRNVNPRKVYPVDPGLIPAFDYSGKPNVGHALETAVLIEIERRGCEVGYVFTPAGYEVDFLIRARDGKCALIQVAADLSDRAVREREFRALADALPTHRRTPAVLLTLTGSDAQAAQAEAPVGVTVRPAWEWILEAGVGAE